MPDFKYIAVNGVGNVGVPSEWSDQQVHDALIKQFPNPQAQAKSAAAMDSFVSARPFGAAPLPSLAPNPAADIEAQSQQARTMARSKLVAQYPMGTLPQDQPNALDYATTPEQRRDLEARANPSQAGVSADPRLIQTVGMLETAKQAAARSEEARQRLALAGSSGQNPVVGEASDLWNKYMRTPNIWGAMDRVMRNTSVETEQGLQDNYHPFTEDLPQQLAPHPHTSGTLESADSNLKTIAKAIGSGLYKFTGQMTTPEMAAVALAAHRLPEGAPSDAVTAGFTAQMLKGGAQQAGSAIKKFRSGDIYGGTEEATQAGLGLGMGLVGGRSLLEDKVTPGEALPTRGTTIQEASQPSTPTPPPIRGLLPAPPSTEFGAKLSDALTATPSTTARPLSPEEHIAANLEAATKTNGSAQALESKVHAYEVAHNLDRDSLAEDIRSKGDKATTPEREFLIDYQRLKGQNIVSVPPPMRLKQPTAEPSTSMVLRVAANKQGEVISKQGEVIRPRDIPASEMTTPALKVGDSVSYRYPDGSYRKGTVEGIDEEHAIVRDMDDRYPTHKIAKADIDVIGAKPIPTMRSANPEEQPQATNPSLPTSNLPAQEDTLRKLVGQNIRIRQLSAAAKDRLQVEFALRDSARRDVPLDDEQEKGRDAADAWLASQGKSVAGNSIVADTSKTLDELDRDEKVKVTAVAKALDIKPKQLQQQQYYLTDTQIDQLKSMRSQGMKPFSLKTVAPDHPEVPFGEYAHYPLAHINAENVKAAGLTRAKDMLSYLSPADKKAWEDFKESGVQPGDEQSSTILGQQKAKASGAVTQGGKDEATLQFEHDMKQKVLGKRLQQVQAAITQRLSAWKEARASETGPSPLSQQIDALSKGSKVGIPKDLYAPEHLGTDASKSGTVPAESQPLQGTTTTPETESTKGGTGTKPQGESADLLDKIAGIANDIESNHGEEAYGALPKIFDAINAKYKSPDYVNKALYAVTRQYKIDLDNKVPNALDKAIDSLKTFPEEKSGSTLYSNPIGPLIQKLFGSRETPVVKQKFPDIGPIPDLPIASFTKDLGERPTASATDQFKGYLANETQRFLEAWRRSPDTIQERWNNLDSFFGKLYSLWHDRPGLNAVDVQMGLRDLKLLKHSIELKDFNETLNSLHPNRLRQAGMSAYFEAGGGRAAEAEVNAKLDEQAGSFTEGRFISRAWNYYAKVWDAARNLTPEEKQTVTNYREYLGRMETRENELGLKHELVEDYIQHLWKPDSFQSRAMMGLQSGRGFGTVANWQRMRSLADYYSGITREDGGLIPKDLTMGYLVTTRAQASARVIANRELVKSLYDTKMPDGMPALLMQGSGTHIEPEEGSDKAGALIIRQNRPKDAVSAAGDPYSTINHPAFQNLKWVGTAPDGTTVLYKASALIHPDAATEMKRVLQPSAIAKPMKIPLAVSTMAKNTLLVGFFHPVQLGVHLLEHATEGIGFKQGQGATNSRVFRAMNPWSKEDFIDLNNPKQQMMVIHGLQLRLFDAENIADEGVMSGGFVRGLPYAGGLWRAFHDSMFTKLIPNMKMSMGLDMLDRNMTRYHDKWTKQELAKAGVETKDATPELWGDASLAAQSRIYRMSAEQTNAAFGGINWRTIPGGKTFRDVLRLTVLAPDFLLARMQFAGDAFRPGGAESARALLTGAFLQYAAARYINSALNDGDAKWDIHDWNRIVYKHTAISLRTQESDMVDMFLDPRTFFSHRLNPVTMRPLFEAWTDKDVFGHPANPGQQMFDFVKNIVPMPAQGAADWAGSKFDPRLRSNKGGDRVADSFLTAMTGVRVQPYRTPAEREVFSQFDAIQGAPPDSELSLEQHNKFNDLRDKWKEGKLTPAMVQDALNSGKLKPTEVRYLRRTAREPQLVTRARHLELDQVFNAWRMGSDSEKIELTPLVLAKLSKVRPTADIETNQTIPKIGIPVPSILRSEEPAKNIRQEVYAFRNKLSQDQLKALHQRTRDEIEWENPAPPKPDTEQETPEENDVQH